MLKEQMPPKKRREPIDYPDGEGGREVCNLKTSKGRIIYRDRLYAMAMRQRFRCILCGVIACYLQFDHQDGRGHGGGHRDDRIEIDGQWHNAALCESCNLRKGSKRYAWVNGKYLPVVKIREVA